MFDSEERRIVKRIKDFIKKEKPLECVYADIVDIYSCIFEYIMLRNGRILDINKYRKIVSDGTIKPQDAYVDISLSGPSRKAGFRYPFLQRSFNVLLDAYLSKLGFYYENFIFPATGLKYVVGPERYGDYLTIELLNLDTVVNNTNLPKIVAEVLGVKLVSGEKELTRDEYRAISDMYKSQRLFAGHDFVEAWGIIYKYYDEGNQSLVKEAARIAMDYYRIFQPYTVCYDMDSWKEIDCWSIKL